jgi:hypothetical protein
MKLQMTAYFPLLLAFLVDGVILAIILYAVFVSG